MPPLKSHVIRMRAVAGFLILGGAWSVVSIARATSTAEFRDGVSVALRLPILQAIPFAVALLAGIFLWRGHRLGGRAAAIVLAPQLFAFHFTDGFAFRFTSGAGVLVGLIGYDFGLSAFQGAGLIASSAVGDGSFMVNLVAATALILLNQAVHDSVAPTAS
jgi:hypothetical protein